MIAERDGFARLINVIADYAGTVTCEAVAARTLAERPNADRHSHGSVMNVSPAQLAT